LTNNNSQIIKALKDVLSNARDVNFYPSLGQLVKQGAKRANQAANKASAQSRPGNVVSNLGRTPRFPLKQKGKMGEYDVFVKPHRYAAVHSTDNRLKTTTILSDPASYILPDGSKFVDEDHKFNLISADYSISAVATQQFYVALMLHAVEVGGSALTVGDIAFTESLSLEEMIESQIPAEAYEHDFKMLTPFIAARAKAHTGTSTVFTVETSVSLKDLFDKINQEYFSNVEHRSRTYRLMLLTYVYTASTITFDTMMTWKGRLVINRSQLL
jgi:hypothetical protein